MRTHLLNADLSSVYCRPNTTHSVDYCRPVYRRPVFLLLCICQLPTCLPPTCAPMSTDYRRPVHLCPLTIADLSFYYFVSTNCLSPTCPYMFTDYRRPVYCRPVFYYFVSANCLPQTCPLTTADLSTIYLSSYSLASANCLHVYRRPAQ